MQPIPLKQIYVKTNGKKSKIVFLDRDGTLSEEKNLLTDESQINIFENSFSAVKLFNDLGYIVLIITNQPVVARGLIALEELRRINDIYFVKFKEKGAIINGIYSCIHHPNANVEKFRAVCKCRKPETLMFESGLTDFNASPEDSIVIGDKTSDIKAGKALNIVSVLVETGFGGKDGNYDVVPGYILKNIYEAALLAKNNFKI